DHPDRWPAGVMTSIGNRIPAILQINPQGRAMGGRLANLRKRVNLKCYRLRCDPIAMLVAQKSVIFKARRENESLRQPNGAAEKNYTSQSASDNREGEALPMANTDLLRLRKEVHELREQI